MDNSLILFGFWLFELSFWVNALQVAIGLGLVIFVHELGHFAVAKFCGVRCDKFYLGFDIAGWKLWKFKAGETEYGIGILPLGGYVKMLGQEDNPGRLKEEIERAKAGQAPLDTPEGEENTEPLSEDQVKELEDALYDPRSYLAQNVPKRMAIISAGVIMNVIFAFVVAAIAYTIGVDQPVCGVGSVHPGGPAWAAGLQTGDMINQINGEKTVQFRDMQPKIFFRDPANKDKGIPFQVKRPGVSEPVEVRVHPSLTKNIRTIGISSPNDTSLIQPDPGFSPIKALSAASKAEPAFEPGDTVIEIDGQKIDNAAQLHKTLALYRDKPLDVIVKRIDPSWDPKKAKKGEEPKTFDVSIKLPPQPLLGVGLVMEMGPIAAVKDGSTAAKAGIEPGDLIKAVDDQEPGDPMTLEQRLRSRVGETITLTVERKKPIDSKAKQDSEGEKDSAKKPKFETKQLEIPVLVGPDDTWNDPSTAFNNSPIAIPELGIAIRVPRVIAGVVPGSPAAKAGVKPGQLIKSVKMIVPPEEVLKKFLTEKEIDRFRMEEKTLSFDTDDEDKLISWPDTFNIFQNVWSSYKFEFVLENPKGKGKKEEKVTLSPVPLEGRFNPDRGITFEPTMIFFQAQSFGEAMQLGKNETLRQMTLIFRFLDALFSGDVSPKALAGPGRIVKMASMQAERGFSEFLLFLTLLSANLAVVNFLPIPVLDGGHMVFLTYELIFRKPANEGVQIALSYLGLLFILGLMVWVIGLDIMWWLS